MKVLDRKLLRELLASKGLILAITSLMAVGVMAFVYMRSAYANLNRAKDDYYRQCRMADFWIDVKKAPLVGTRGAGGAAGSERGPAADSILCHRRS